MAHYLALIFVAVARSARFSDDKTIANGTESRTNIDDVGILDVHI
jgi:hypothetical protein